MRPDPVPAADRRATPLPPAPPRVRMGDRVEVELIRADGEREQLAFDIVADHQADFAAGFLAAGAPLARALLGQPVGAAGPEPGARQWRRGHRVSSTRAGRTRP